MSPFGALFDLALRLQFNRSRIVALAVLGAIGIAVGVGLGLSNDVALSDRVAFLDGFALTLVLPVTTLIFASSSFGDMTDDQTLVYVWLRDQPRWQLAAASMLASLTIVLPLVVVPLVATAVALRLNGDAVAGAALATIAGSIAYTGVFTALGLRAKRALVWGLLYIFIWEQFIARAGRGVRRYTISNYTRSILSKITHVKLRDADISLVFAVIVPIVVGVAAFLYTSRRLDRHDVA